MCSGATTTAKRTAGACLPPSKTRTGLTSPQALGLHAGADAFIVSQTHARRSTIMQRTPISSWRTLVNERVLCRRRGWKGFLSGLAALFLFLGTVGQARCQFLYWADFDGGTIQRANLDGTGAVILVRHQPGPLGPTLDLAGGLMYWINYYGGDIRRANLDGSGETILIRGLSGIHGLALDLAGGLMYWPNFDSGEIWRAKLDGSEPTLLVKGLSNPLGFKLDLAGGKMYFAERARGTIDRANLDGTGLEVLIGNLDLPRGVALDLPGGKMYWSNLGSSEIRRANLDGSGQEIVIPAAGACGAIALDLPNGKLYWCDFVIPGDIRRANLDGSGQETLITGLPGRPGGLALDLGAPGTAVFFAVVAPASVPSGNSFDLTVTALDPYGHRDVNYQGTVTFSTTDLDSGVVLPADYTFITGVGGDNGVHTFPGGGTLVTAGDQTITATDTVSGITRSVTVTVGPGP
jgi:sugar lactone lactonase YvrE